MNIEIIEQSFKLIKNRGKEFSASFYTNLLGNNPELQPLFANTKMEDQGKHLFDSLRYVVNNLSKPEIVQNALKELGSRHVKYGVRPQHYPLVGGALLKTLESFVDWTPEVKQAWTSAYAAITEVMLEGAKNKIILVPNS